MSDSGRTVSILPLWEEKKWQLYCPHFRAPPPAWIPLDLSSTPEAQDQVERGLLLDVIVRERSTVFELFAGEDEALLIRWDAFLVLYFSFDVFYGV